MHFAAGSTLSRHKADPCRKVPAGFKDLGGASGAERLSIVIQKTRQLRMQKSEIRLVRRWAVLSFDSSALQPDLRILWNTSIFHLKPYHSSFSIASARTNRQVGDQLPIDLLSAFRRPALFGMDHRQGQSGIALLLSDWRQDAGLAIPDLKNGLVGIAVATGRFPFSRWESGSVWSSF